MLSATHVGTQVSGKHRDRILASAAAAHCGVDILGPQALPGLNYRDP